MRTTAERSRARIKPVLMGEDDEGKPIIWKVKMMPPAVEQKKLHEHGLQNWEDFQKRVEDISSGGKTADYILFMFDMFHDLVIDPVIVAPDTPDLKENEMAADMIMETDWVKIMMVAKGMTNEIQEMIKGFRPPAH